MTERVAITLDVTIDEARAIAERLAGVGPYYQAWNLPLCLDEVAEMAPREGMVKKVKIRSEASIALGGPQMD